MNYRIKNWYYRCRNAFFRNDESISYEEATELLDRGQTIIIDVRTQEEYEQNHIQGAINIPVNEIAYKIEKVEPDKNKIIIVYCKTGKRSRMAKNCCWKKGTPIFIYCTFKK